MSAYRFCRIPTAENPFYLETIGVNAWSYEEICYYIVNYPSLIDGSFMNASLTNWLSTELGLLKLGRTLDKVLRGEGGDEADGNVRGKNSRLADFLVPILKEDGYLAQSELKTFEAGLLRAEEEGSAKGLKKKGDALVRCGRLSGAIEVYDEILKLKDDEDPSAGAEPGKDSPAKKDAADKVFLASVWHNRGVAYMQLFEYTEAVESFRNALETTYTRDALKTYLYAVAIARPRDRYEEELARLGVDETTAAEVDRELKKAGDTIPRTPETEADRYLEALTRDYHKAAGV